MYLFPDAKSKASVLEHARISREMDWDELCLLASYMTVQELRAGETLFEEGDPGAFMGVMARGVVSVVKRAPGGGEIIVGDIHVRQVVGEQAMLDGEPRSASVYAQTPVVLLALRREAYDTIMERHPRLGSKLMKALAKEVSARLRKTTGQLASDNRHDFLMR